MRKTAATLALTVCGCAIVANTLIAAMAAAATPNPCGLISKAQMSTAMGTKIAATVAQSGAAGSTCTYDVTRNNSSDGYGSVFVVSTAVASAGAKTHHTTDISTPSGFKMYYLSPRGSQGPAFDQKVSGVGQIAGFNSEDSEIDVLANRDLLSISIDKVENGATVPTPESTLVSLARLALKRI